MHSTVPTSQESQACYMGSRTVQVQQWLLVTLTSRLFSIYRSRVKVQGHQVQAGGGSAHKAHSETRRTQLQQAAITMHRPVGSRQHGSAGGGQGPPAGRLPCQCPPQRPGPPRCLCTGPAAAAAPLAARPMPAQQLAPGVTLWRIALHRGRAGQNFDLLWQVWAELIQKGLLLAVSGHTVRTHRTALALSPPSSGETIVNRAPPLPPFFGPFTHCIPACLQVNLNLGTDAWLGAAAPA